MGERLARRGSLLVVAALAAATGRSVAAAEIHVLSAGAVQEAASEVAERFHARIGHGVTFTFGTVGTIEDAIKAGARADVILLSTPALDAQTRGGTVVAGSGRTLGTVGIGVAVKEGAPRPDLSTPNTFKAALLAATSIVYADPAKGASSGIHFASVLATLGIAEAVAAKSKKLRGGYVVELVAKGEAEIGIHQISEILPVKGVTLVGPLPAPLQKYTVYAGGVAAKAAEPAVAKAFVDALTDLDGQGSFRHAGFTAGN